jgi:plastocyanin
MKKVIGVVVAIIVIVIIVVLLASGKTNAPEPAKSPNPSLSTSVAPSATVSPTGSPAAVSKITITNYAFSPSNITVTKGTTVTWTNKDAVAHTVTETDGKNGPKSGDLNQNQTYSFTFNQVGTFKYDCSLHPYMTGTVTVTE